MTDIARRQLFRRACARKPEPQQRMPWLISDTHFTDMCTRCGKCQDVCETAIIVKGDGGFPVIDFSKGECTFCGKCADICPEPLFQPVDTNPWQQVAVIGETCLATKGIECRSCGDMCEYQAIRFRLRPGGVARPTLNSADCSGCGACVSPCPVTAITIETTGSSE